MTDKARELLERALDHMCDMNSSVDCLLKEEIRAYLAQPEVNQELVEALEDLMKGGEAMGWSMTKQKAALKKARGET